MRIHHALLLATVTAGIASSLTTPTGAAQAPAPDQIVAALKQNLADSKAKLRQYEWIETTSISLKGEEKSRKQQRVYYGADGTLTKVPMGGAPPQKAEQGGGGGGRRGARLKEQIVENKKDELKDYMEAAGSLIQLYVPPNPAQIQQAKDKGNMQVKPQPQGTLRIEFSELRPGIRSAGDRTWTRRRCCLSAINVATYVETERGCGHPGRTLRHTDRRHRLRRADHARRRGQEHQGGRPEHRASTARKMKAAISCQLSAIGVGRTQGNEHENSQRSRRGSCGRRVLPAGARPGVSTDD